VTLLAAGELLGIYTQGNSEQDLPLKMLSSVPAPALGFCMNAEAGRGLQESSTAARDGLL